MLRFRLSFRTLFFCLCLMVNACAGHAQKASQPTAAQASNPAFKKWVVAFAAEAKHKGIQQTTLTTFVNQVEYLPRVIELDRKQPDVTKTFDEYLTIVIPKQRLLNAQENYEKHKELLTKIGMQYGVQPRFIVALWAIESDFGNNMGGFNIINSLATLAYEGRRAEFFKMELLNALKMVDQDRIALADMKGSWAGAMGQTQFMPSSFLELAVDHNSDHKRDIWKTHADVFASIANYLSKSGWNNNITWGREVQLPPQFNKLLLGRETVKSISAWSKLGVKQADGNALTANKTLKASIVVPNKTGGKAYIVYQNYNVIMKWNRSLYFATAVGILSDAIKE
jgi:membrane-bound lytic murein transglycosylase B